MEDSYPKYNPAQGLSELINQKARKLDTIDKTKYAGYYNQTIQELRELQFFCDGLSTLNSFDVLVEIQRAIDLQKQQGISILSILIPLDHRCDRLNIGLLDFTERSPHER